MSSRRSARKRPQRQARDRRQRDLSRADDDGRPGVLLRRRGSGGHDRRLGAQVDQGRRWPQGRDRRAETQDLLQRHDQDPPFRPGGHRRPGGVLDQVGGLPRSRGQSAGGVREGHPLGGADAERGVRRGRRDRCGADLPAEGCAGDEGRGAGGGQGREGPSRGARDGGWARCRGSATMALSRRHSSARRT